MYKTDMNVLMLLVHRNVKIVHHNDISDLNYLYTLTLAIV